MRPVVAFAVIAVVIGAVVHSVLAGAVVAAVAIGIWWRHDVRRRPSVPCSRCNGSGSTRSAFGGGLLRRPAGDCGHCGGKKGVPRLALRVADSAAWRSIRAGISKGKGAIRR
jgi:hypothetical protein